MKTIIICIALAVIAAAGWAAAQESIAITGPTALLNSGFEANPVSMGWSHVGQTTAGNWQDTIGHAGGRCLFTNEGSWDSPLFPVAPFNYYKVKFWSKLKPRPAGTPWTDAFTAPPTPDGYPAVWAAVSADINGKPLVSDHWWAVDLSSKWAENEFITYSKANSAFMGLRFQPYVKTAMWVDDVTVEPVDYRYAAKWIDGMFAQMPSYKFSAQPDRWTYIPKTMNALNKGGTIKIVMLGDSICNDTANSSWHALVQRMYPKAHLEVVSSVRGGTGNVWYQNDNHVKEYVIDYNPDLLIIAGISQGNDAEAARSVIKQVRAVSNPEIMFMTPVVGAGDPCKPGANDKAAEDFRTAMQKVCQDEKVEYVDMWSPWKDYVCTGGKPVSWYHRDFVHANQRGAVVLAKIIEAYFAPKGK